MTAAAASDAAAVTVAGGSGLIVSPSLFSVLCIKVTREICEKCGVMSVRAEIDTLCTACLFLFGKGGVYNCLAYLCEAVRKLWQ